MNIWIVSLGYPNIFNETANIFTYEQVKALKENYNDNYTVLFLNMYPTRKIFNKKTTNDVKFYNDGNTDVYELEMKTLYEKKFSHINAIHYYKMLKKLFNAALKKSGTPDLVYAHFSCYTGWATTKYFNKKGVPVVVQEHAGGIISGNLNAYKKKLLKKTVELSNEFICVSQGLSDAVKAITGCDKNFPVIGNMVDDIYKFMPKKQSDYFTFLSVGNLYPTKCMEMLVRAFIQAFDKDENVKLRICGDGECRANLEKLIIQNDRKEQIYLLGRQSRKTIYNEYCGCDAFVLASDHETFGIVYREAMAIGRPIITTNHGGFSDTDFSDKDGIMIPKNKQVELENALRLMYKNIDRYNGEDISSRCLMQYSAENVAKQIHNILIKQSKM